LLRDETAVLHVNWRTRPGPWRRECQPARFRCYGDKDGKMHWRNCH